MTLAGLAAGRLRAEGLPAAMTRIGTERPVAMQALGARGNAGHRQEEDAAKNTPPHRDFGSAEITPLRNGADIGGRAFVTEGLGSKRLSGIIDKDGEWIRQFPKTVEGFFSEISEVFGRLCLKKGSGVMDLDGNVLFQGDWHPLTNGKLLGGAFPAWCRLRLVRSCGTDRRRSWEA